MGDMADFANQGLEREEQYEGQLYGNHPNPYTPRAVNSHLKTCKFCGQPNLHWRKTEEGRWRLHNDQRQLHFCMEYSQGRTNGKSERPNY